MSPARTKKSVETFSKRRIAFLMPHLVMGGVEKVLCQYLTVLCKREDITCDVVSAKEVTEEWVLEFFRENQINLIDNVLPEIKEEPLPTHLFKRWIARRKTRALKKERRDRLIKLISSYDVAIDFNSLSFSRYMPRVHTLKIGFIHVGFPFFTSMDKEALAAYDKLVCLTDSFVRDVEREYPRYASMFTRLYNPIDAKQVWKQVHEAAAVSTRRPYFVAVQRLNNEDKSVGTIIRAFERFQKIHPDYTLYVVGDGPDREELEEMSSCPKIIFTGQVDNPYPLIKSAEGLILSSRKDFGEGLGMVLVEAQALGVLCISSDVKSGPAEILMGGEAGWLFEAESVESLYETLCRVVESPEENRQKIETATKHMERFVVSNIIEQFMKMVGEEKNEMR